MSPPRIEVELDGVVLDLALGEFEERVRRGLIGASHRLRFPVVTGDVFVRAGELELFQSIEDAPRTRFVRRFDGRRVPRVTLATALLLLGTFAWQLHQPGPLDDAALIRQGAKSLPHQVELGQWWRLATASLLHASWLHLIPNLAYLLFVGWRVESVLGASATLLLLVASALGSMGLSSWLTPAATVGASGMAFGLFGAAVTVGWRFGPWLPPRARVRYGWPMVPFVAGFLAVGMTSPTLDNICHLGGLLTGGLLALMLSSSLTERRPLRRGLVRVTVSALLLAWVTIAMPLLSRADLLGGAGLGKEAVVAAEGGWSLRPPKGWQTDGPAQEPTSWRSRTGLARLSVSTRADATEPPSLDAVRRGWLADLAEHGVVLPRGEVQAGDLGLGEGWFTQDADLVSGDTVWRSLRAGRRRGVYVTTLEFLVVDDRLEDYARLRRRVGATVELLPPRGLARALEGLGGRRLSDAEEVEAAARSLVALARQAPIEGLRVAAELARLGRAEDARRYLAVLPDDAETRYWSLWTDLYLDSVVPAPSRVEALLAASPDSPRVAALVFDALSAAGSPRAEAVLRQMVERWPRSPWTEARRGEPP